MLLESCLGLELRGQPFAHPIEGEDTFAGERGEGGFGTTPAQAKAQIADLKLDKAFMDKYLSGDKDAVGKMSRLMEAAYAGG